jgi:hypothetical protein
MALLHRNKFDNEPMEEARKSLCLAFVRGPMTDKQKKYAESLAKPLWGKIKAEKRERRNRQHFVYGISNGEYLKIGYANNPNRRLADLQVGNPNNLEIRGLIECPDQKSAKRIERKMHRACKRHRVRGEWFNMAALEIFGDFKTDGGTVVFVTDGQF